MKIIFNNGVEVAQDYGIIIGENPYGEGFILTIKTKDVTINIGKLSTMEEAKSLMYNIIKNDEVVSEDNLPFLVERK